MATYNQVQLWGKLISDPIISIDNITHEPVKASFFMSVINQARDSGVSETDCIYSQPFIYSQDPEIISKIVDWKKGDIVDLRGLVTTLDAKRGVQCINCKQKIMHDGEVTLITPTFAELRYSGLNDVEADELMKQHREISNRVLLLGNLTKEPAVTKKSKYYGDLISRMSYKGLTSFQLAVDRHYFVKGDDPCTKTDYPHIVSIGSRAEDDALALVKGSTVMVDGMLATRTFRRTHTCPLCQAVFDREERVTEIITYSTEYLANCKTFEGTAAEEKQRRHDAALTLSLQKLGVETASPVSDEE